MPVRSKTHNALQKEYNAAQLREKKAEAERDAWQKQYNALLVHYTRAQALVKQLEAKDAWIQSVCSLVPQVHFRSDSNKYKAIRDALIRLAGEAHEREWDSTPEQGE